MEAVLTFKFDPEDPDDKRALKRYANATEMALLLWNIQMRLRDRCMEKISTLVEDPELDRDTQILYIVSEEINEMFSNEGIDLDTLII